MATLVSFSQVPGAWYWIVAGAADKVYSSAAIGYVPVKNSNYVGWLAAGNVATAIASEGDLAAVLTAAGLPFGLAAYAASARYAKETAGITVNGVKVATDRASQALITGAWATTQINPAATIQWKGADGTFVTLDAKAITGLASAVTAHVQACFAAEAQVGADIASGKVKTTADVDAAFAAVTA